MRNSVGFKAAVLCGSACLLLSAGSLHAQTFNGLTIEPRVFNDFAASTETATINGGLPIPTPLPTPAGNLPVSGLPASVTIHDTNMTRVAAGGANRDDILLSTDGGATAYVGNINTGFNVSATITLTNGTNSPRKEVGIRINSSPASGVGDSLFLINSDAGEVVAFGGPFFNLRGIGAPTYVPGQTITLSETYTPGHFAGGTTGANPGTIQYSAQYSGGPLFTSGPLAYSNKEGGPVDYTVGVYDQTGSSSPTDFINAQFNNITASVPEPASLSVLALGGLAMLTRRRAAKLV